MPVVGARPAKPRRAASRPATRFQVQKPRQPASAWTRQPQDTFTPRTSFTPAPAGGAPAPAKPATTDPRDPTYWAQRAKLIFQRDQEVNRLTREQAYSDQDFTEALRRRAEDKPKQVQSIREGANREGLLFSGQLGRRVGEFETAFQREESDARLSHEREKAARQAARDALAQGYTLEEAALLAEAVARQQDRDFNNSLYGAAA